jgi:hypothetical protein
MPILKNYPLYFLAVLLSVTACQKEEIIPTPPIPSNAISLKLSSDHYFIDHQKGLILSTFDIKQWQTPSKETPVGILELEENYTFKNAPSQLDFGQGYPLEKEGKTYQLYFTKLPLLHIQSSKKIVDEPKVKGNLQIIAYNEPPFESEIGIEIRGGSSQSFDKKSYGFELLESDSDETRKASLLGLRSDDDWILDAMYIDPYRMRNLISHQLWQDLYMLPYQEKEEDAKAAIDGKHVEVFKNGKYIGVYTLLEKVDRKLLQLKKPKSAIRGELYKGVAWGLPLLEEIKNYDNSSRFWGGFEFIYPKEDFPTDWGNLHDLVQFIVQSPDETFQNEIGERWELQNAIDYFIFLNLLRAWDNRGKNIYITRYQQDSPYFYTPWDCDATWGLFWDGNNDPTISGILDNGLFKRLISLNAQNFNVHLKNRWQTLRQGLLSEQQLMARFEHNFNQLQSNGVYEREKNRWQLDNTPNDLNYINNWLSGRLTYLDTYFE